MSVRKQEIKTKLTADNSQLNKALDEAQQGLKDTSKEAQRTQKSIDNALKGGKGGGKGIADDIAKHLTSQKSQRLIGDAAGKLLGDSLGKEAGRVGGKYLGSLVAGLTAKSGSLLNGAGSAIGSKIGSGIAAGIGGTAAAVTTAVAAVAVAAAYAFGKRFQQAAGVIEGANKNFDGDTNLFQKIQATGKGKGNEGNVNALTAAYKKFVDVLERAKKGEEEAVKILADFGWQAKDFSSNSGEAFIQAIQALSRHTEKSNDALKLFGNNSTEAMKAYEALAKQPKLNLIPESEIDAAKRLSEAIEVNRQSWEALKERMGFDLLTEKVSETWSSMAEGMDDFMSELQWTMAGIAGGPKAMSDAEMAEARRLHMEDVERQKAAREAEKEARREKARQERNRQADEATLRYQQQQIENQVRLANERNKYDEEIRRAHLSPHERWQEDAQGEYRRLLGMGYTSQQATERMGYWKSKNPEPVRNEKIHEQVEFEEEYRREMLSDLARWEEDRNAEIARLKRMGYTDQEAMKYLALWLKKNPMPPQNQNSAPSYESSYDTSYGSSTTSKNEFYSGRSSRRFADAKEARERARAAKERAKDLRRQAKIAKKEGRKSEARQLLEEADENDAQYERSLSYSKKVRARAKQDEKNAFSVDGVSPRNPTGKIDYTSQLNSIIDGIAQLKSNTYVVK